MDTQIESVQFAARERAGSLSGEGLTTGSGVVGSASIGKPSVN